MALDLSAGLSSQLDEVVVDPPDVPGFGENHAVWLFDESGEHHLNFHLETVPHHWSLRREHGYATLPDQRTLVVQGEGHGSTRHQVCSATTSFSVVEPFVRWTGQRRGTARSTSLEELRSHPHHDGERAPLDFDFEATMALPPWIQGAVSEAAHEEMKVDAGQFIGGFRYEQLFRANVEITVDDGPKAEPRRFAATGLRTHRAGPRNMGEMLGHSWATALFPSGRAFGYQRYPRPGGEIGFSEGWMTADEQIDKMEVKTAPWLEELPEPGQKFAIDFEHGGRRQSVDVELRSAMLLTVSGSGDLAWMRQGLHDIDGLVLVQSMARFSWDGEETYGLLERSALRKTFK
jgi:hypothetical protein